MSIFEALVVAGIIVSGTIAVLCGIALIVAFLSVLKPIGWLVIGVIIVVTLLLTIGIYLYDKHSLN